MIIALTISANSVVSWLVESVCPAETDSEDSGVGLCERWTDGCCKAIIYNMFLFEWNTSL